EGEGGLARAGIALEKIDPVGREAAAQDVIQAGDAGGDQVVPARVPRRFAHSPPGLQSEACSSIRSEGREVPKRRALPLLGLAGSLRGSRRPAQRFTISEPPLRLNGQWLCSHDNASITAEDP